MGNRFIVATTFRLKAGSLLSALFALGIVVAFCRGVVAEPATAVRGMVATVHPLATDAGVAAFRQGGNTVDAAVAAALTLGVVNGHNSGIGGGCLILIRCPNRTWDALDGRETAPARSRRDTFLHEGKPQPEWSKTGPLAAGTPGALAAYREVMQRHGRLSLRELLLPAAQIAEDGFRLDKAYADALRDNAPALSKFSGSREMLLKPDGGVYAEGETLCLRDLARTYRAVAEHGTDWFYQGEFADKLEAWMQDHGGLLGREDLAGYRVRQRQPIVTSYRQWTIVGFPPPSSGGAHVAQILNILEHFDLKSLHDEDEAQSMHVIVEAMKLAFADRAHWLGDADFANVPRGIVDKSYAAELARRIDRKVAGRVTSHGQPPRADSDLFERHTTHVAAADASGFWVAITATINTSFGSKVVIPGTGVVLNNEMDDFAIQPGVPNAFGLLGAEANAVEPRKRPLSSMSPTVVVRDGEPVISLGAAGGPTIISQVVVGLIRYLDLGLPLDQALTQPRFHHQWSPDQLVLERGFSVEIAQRLGQLGHTLRDSQRLGATQAVAWDREAGQFIGVHDPRVAGKAAGY